MGGNSEIQTGTYSLRRWICPEILFGSLGLVLSVALIGKTGVTVISLAALGLWMTYCVAIHKSDAAGRWRLGINYLAAWAFYGGSSLVIESLQLPLHHVQLLRWDRALLGETPGVTWQGVVSPRMNDLLSAGYLSYHIYLHWVLLDALGRSNRWRAVYGRIIYTAFAIGFLGYFAYPAGDPRQAVSELYRAPVEGGWLTQWNDWVIAHGGARYDAFPSLHMQITTVLLVCDWRWQHRRFLVMLLPALVLMASTLLLRLHFAVDLLAGFVLAVVTLWIVGFRELSVHE